MLTHDPRWSLPRGNTLVPSRWQATLGAHSATVEIILGRYQAKTVACRQCGSVWTGYEEKITDVNIAASLVPDAAAGRPTSH
jgi:hypothetical protein